MRLLQHILRFVFVIGCVTQVTAQTDPCLDRTIPVNVYTERGEPFTPLTAASLQASVGGKPIRVTSLTLDTGPRRMVVLLDVSGSMTVAGNLKCALEFTHDLISLTPLRDSLALLTFNDRIKDVVAFGQSQDTLLADVNKLQDADWGHGKTAIIDALGTALAMMKSPRVGDAICLVSDGGDNASQSNRSRVKALLESSAIRLYAFLPALQYSPSRTSEDDISSQLHGLASATGGDFRMFGPGREGSFSDPFPRSYAGIGGDRKEITLAARRFHDEFFSFEKLTVRLPEPLAKPHEWKLDVVDASGQRIKHLQVFYPQRLAPCITGDNP
ncbi:MAG TPA: vWA domain-containing protein [Terriglobia bacterium]|nr:vWA domain-containing protein [Terriglobia bacterium]